MEILLFAEYSVPPVLGSPPLLSPVHKEPGGPIQVELPAGILNTELSFCQNTFLDKCLSFDFYLLNQSLEKSVAPPSSVCLKIPWTESKEYGSTDSRPSHSHQPEVIVLENLVSLGLGKVTPLGLE